MSRTDRPSRRDFVKLCASAIAVVGSAPHVLAQPGAVTRRYDRVRLTGANERPLTPGDLAVGETYVFHYPFVATPCFLLDLGRAAPARDDLATEAGEHYSWRGGVGPGRSIVAFSAICAHKMSHPARSVTFIDYRHEPVSFLDSERKTRTRERVIYCCSEGSVYDPADGGRVLGGPAPQPLAAIVLEQDADGSLYASGTCGGEMFDRFFRTFGFRLKLEMQRSDIEAPVAATTPVVPLSEYSGSQIHC